MEVLRPDTVLNQGSPTIRMVILRIRGTGNGGEADVLVRVAVASANTAGICAYKG